MIFKRRKKLNVGIAYPAFMESFMQFFPDLFLVRSEEDIALCDLIIFSGGEDINPEIYKQENTESRGINLKRDEYELAVLHYAKKWGTKLLGVCRGHQLLNAYFGGQLVQDIKPYHMGFHELEIKNQASFEPTIFPNGVNSMHHQGVTIPGNNFTVLSEHNGVIESAISDKAISVQYHPEFMNNYEFFNYVKEWVLS